MLVEFADQRAGVAEDVHVAVRREEDGVERLVRREVPSVSGGVHVALVDSFEVLREHLVLVRIEGFRELPIHLEDRYLPDGLRFTLARERAGRREELSGEHRCVPFGVRGALEPALDLDHVREVDEPAGGEGRRLDDGLDAEVRTDGPDVRLESVDERERRGVRLRRVQREDGAVAQLLDQPVGEARLVGLAVRIAREHAVEVLLDVAHPAFERAFVRDYQLDRAAHVRRLLEELFDGVAPARFVTVDTPDDREFGVAVAQLFDTHWPVVTAGGL